ncbi:MAG TPA: acetylxylan esterase [Candidatus Hydrogenedentes bacterium]|nr:acetylxylan esterase [Candidatus Hydrogenedentota bacterium]
MNRRIYAHCNVRMLAAALLLAGIFLTAATAAPVEMPWDKDALFKTPEIFPAEEFSEPGIRALFYEGLPFQEKPTRVFAWYGTPTGAAGEKFPGMVLVHGGGGTAFAEWVRLWVKRGYCAIAMDTCGCVPRGEYGNWERHDAGGPAGWGGFDQLDAPIKDQWTYHAIADVLLAHSLLRSFPEVDAERTGVTGISWGGYLTCIAASIDSRFKLAVPVYGCGFLGEDSAWVDTFKGMGEEKAAAWLGRWDPSVYLSGAAMPMLWVTGTNDFAYPMNALQKSYRLPGGPRTLCIRIRMPHGHGGAGENPEEIHAFTNSILRSGGPLPVITAQGRDGQTAWATFAAGTPVEKAELVYTKAVGKWQDRLWESVPGRVNQEAGRATGILPEGTTVYYLNLTDEKGHIVSSEHEVLTD